MSSKNTSPAWAKSDVERWFDSLNRDDLRILEHKGRALYPDEVKRLNPTTGAVEGVPILLRVPNTHEKIMARKAALKWAKDLLGDKKLKGEPTIDDVNRFIGEVYWQHLDNTCLLSFSVFEAKVLKDGTPQRYMLPKLFDASFQPTSIYALMERLTWWAEREDPRIVEDDLTEEAVLKLAEKVAEMGHTGPLLVTDGPAQINYIVSSARLLVTSRTPKSSSPSPETSTAAE